MAKPKISRELDWAWGSNQRRLLEIRRSILRKLLARMAKERCCNS